MQVFFVLLEFGLAAMNTALGVNALMNGRPAGVMSIAVAVFCFGCGLFICFRRS